VSARLTTGGHSPTAGHCSISPDRIIMAKGQEKKKTEKKEPAKTFKEKRAAKKDKKEGLKKV
jgi:hypothetical protein